MTSAQALKKYLILGLVSEYEEREIFDYKEIWYIGKEGTEKVKGSILKEPNNGYDDAWGDYQEVTHDHIAYRYEIISLLG